MLEIIIFFAGFYIIGMAINKVSESIYWMWVEWRSKNSGG
jgi:hypothetical protein